MVTVSHVPLNILIFSSAIAAGVSSGKLISTFLAVRLWNWKTISFPTKNGSPMAEVVHIFSLSMSSMIRQVFPYLSFPEASGLLENRTSLISVSPYKYQLTHVGKHVVTFARMSFLYFKLMTKKQQEILLQKVLWEINKMYDTSCISVCIRKK